MQEVLAIRPNQHIVLLPRSAESVDPVKARIMCAKLQSALNADAQIMSQTATSALPF